MIVNATAEGWEVIFQRAHEQLAMQLAMHWHPRHRPGRWAETLAAIGDHDNEQEPWHGKFHINSAGAPLDFTQKPIQHSQIEKVVTDATYKSRFIALLISLHTQYLYTEAARTDGKLAGILKEQAKMRTKWLKSLAISLKEAEAAYRLLHWCDRCSLILCRQELPEDERRLDIFAGPDEQMYQIWQRSNGTLGVNPWPFSTQQFTVNVEARSLKQLAFKNDEELAEALYKTPVEEKVWEFKK